MKVYFEDKQFSFQLLRLLGSSVSGGSDVGECLSTAYRINEGDFESWYSEWNRTAERIRKTADDCLAGGHNVSAREAYMRAYNYYRSAEFYLHGDPDDPRIAELAGKALDCFSQVVSLSPLDIEPLEIPYEGTTLPGYIYRPDRSGNPKPTLIAMTGYDGTQEEFLGLGAASASRGLNCVTFEGPGQGSVIHEQGLPFRPDWENVVTPVVDHVLGIPDVDPKKVALLGLSFGGYLAPRAAAFEHRLAALVANGGVFDFMGSRVPAGMTREQFFAMARDYPEEFNKNAEEAMKDNTDMRWGIQHGMYVLKASSPADYMVKAMEYVMEGVADKIECPTLVIDSENDFSFPGEAKKLYDALTCPKTWLLFTAEEGADDHCQVGAQLLSGQRIFDWLEETLDGIT